MQFTLKKLVLVVAVACVIALAAGNYINSPERRIRLAGVDYNLKYKAGDFLHTPHGIDFDDESMAEIVAIAADFSRPHAIGISGDGVTDNGFRVFNGASKIDWISLTNLSVTHKILPCFADMPDLKYIRIENCPNIPEDEIHKFRLANTQINVESK